jgi:hypothetical protein
LLASRSNSDELRKHSEQESGPCVKTTGDANRQLLLAGRSEP